MADPNGAPTPRDDAPDESGWTDAWADERWSELVAELEGPAGAGATTPARDDGPRRTGGSTGGTAGTETSAAGTPGTGATESGPAGTTSATSETGTSDTGTAASEDGWGAFDVAPWVRQEGPRDWPTSEEVEALEEEQSHYRPPEPPPVLGHDPLKNLAWGAIALVPTILLVTLLVVRPFPRLVGEIGGLVFLAAVAVLVWRMPHSREDDDDPGAVV